MIMAATYLAGVFYTDAHNDGDEKYIVDLILILGLFDIWMASVVTGTPMW